MNRDGAMAFRHNARHRPRSLASLVDPRAYFARLGEETAARITDLRDEILGPPRPGEDLDAYRRRAYSARAQAEETVLAEMVWLAAEEDPTPETDEVVLAYRGALGASAAARAEADRTWTDTPAEAPGPA